MPLLDDDYMSMWGMRRRWSQGHDISLLRRGMAVADYAIISASALESTEEELGSFKMMGYITFEEM